MEESARLLQENSTHGLKDTSNYPYTPLHIDYKDFKQFLYVLYYHWRNPTIYLCLICINIFIIISCLMYKEIPFFTLILEILVMCTFTFELVARGTIYGLESLWLSDGKIDTIAYIMCLLSMFGYKNFSTGTVTGLSEHSSDSERYVKVMVVSFRIIAHLLRLSRTVICHHKAKMKFDAQSWYEMEETV